jgi:hypothetical protein
LPVALCRPFRADAGGELTQAKAHARQHKGVSFWKKCGRRLES